MKTIKYLLLFLLTISSLSSAHAGRGRIEEIDPLYKSLSAEAEKDLKGLPSCFKGEVKKKFEEMQENYGGRFGNNYNLELMKISETQYRYLSKYCDRTLDRNMQEVGDHTPESEYAYRQCIHTNTSNSIAGITFDAATTGTFETEGLIFQVRNDVTNDILVKYDAGYHPEDEEIISWKTIEELECTIVK